MLDNKIKNLVSVIVSCGVAVTLLACDKTPKQLEQVKQSVAKLTEINQAQLNQLAETLDVKYQAFSNIETDCPDKNGQPINYCFSAEISFTSPSDVLADQWKIHYSQVYPVYASQSSTLSLTHLNGDIHSIEPNKNFSGFHAKQPHTIKIWIASTVLTESELMPNYWISADQLTPAVIASTKTQIDAQTGLELQPWVQSFDNVDKQIKSSPEDINQYASAKWLYEHNQGIKYSTNKVAQSVIPTPTKLIVNNSELISLTDGINLHYQGLQPQDVSGALARLAKLGVEQNPAGIEVKLVIDNQLSVDESYHFVAQNKVISIKAADNAGAFYALQTLAALLSLDNMTIPSVEIADQPKYSYRGQHLDVARNFHSKAMVLRLIEQMSAYKLNKLHMHLAEDEGWRIELPSLPELTQIGANRCMELTDKQCMQPQLGGAGASNRDGYYSAEDYIEILRYAKQHYIEVIPSLDMPGHSRAAIKAMEARYQHFIEQENPVEATRYLLTDFNDKTRYSSIQNYHDNTINVCLESSYAFVDRVLDDLIALHQQAEQPLKMYHIGADETAGAWVDSPACQALIADQSNDVSDVKHLSAHFIERVAHMVANKGIAVGGWNDGLGETDNERMPKQVYSYIWGSLPGGAHQMVSEQARSGWQVVLSIPDVLYFDFPYEVDPKERGYNWASRRLDSRNLFNFIPDNLPIHAEFRLDTLGRHFVSDDRQQQNSQGEITHQPLPLNYQVTGIQGQLWSETVRSDHQAEYMIFPRLMALAERAWSTPSWHVPYNYQGAKYDQTSSVFTQALKQQRDSQWQVFANTIGQKELAKLDKLGVFYRIPTVGAKYLNDKLYINSSLPGLPLEYRVANEPWQIYQQPVVVKKPVSVRARSADGQRAGRSLLVQ